MTELAARLSEIEETDYSRAAPGAGIAAGVQLLGEGLLKELSAAYVKGANPDWSSVYHVRHRQVRLPLYPFEPVRCWMDCPDPQPIPLWETGWELSAEPVSMARASEHADSIASNQASSPSSFYKAGIPDGQHSRRTLIIHSGDMRAEKIADALDTGHESGPIIEVLIGHEGSQSENVERLHASDPDYERLFAVHDPDHLERIVFLYTTPMSEESGGASAAQLWKGLDQGFFHLIALCKALASKHGHQPELVIVTTGAYSVTGTEARLSPDSRSLLHSLGESLPLETPDLWIRSIDVDKATSAEGTAG